VLAEQSTARTAPAEGDKKKGPQATPAAPPEGTATPAEGAAQAPTGEAPTGESASAEATPSEPTATLPAGEVAVATIASVTPGPAPALSVPSTPTTEATPRTATEIAPTPAQKATEPIAEDPTPIVSTPQAEVPVDGGEASSTPTPAPAKTESTVEAPTSPAPMPTGSIALPDSVEPVVADPETAIKAAPKSGSAEMAAPSASKADGPAIGSGGREAAGGGGSTSTEGGDARSDAGIGAGRRAVADAATPRPTVPSGVPALAAPAQPSAPVANVVFSSPTAPAPSPTAALEATLRMAGERGFTRARVTLRPAELGGVEVFLREGSAGLTATVVAETPHAAHLLQSSATELQRRLAAQGLELSSLQISVGGESAGAAHGGRDDQGAAQASGTGGRGAAAEPSATAEKTQTIDLGGGVLVDVLA